MTNNLTVQMLAAAILAVALALLSETQAGQHQATDHDIIALIKTTFLAALRMLIAPMIFSLIAGISNISEAASWNG